MSPDTAPAAESTPLCGLVLAAGAGRRFGGPKGLARTADGVPWVQLAVAALREGGCDRVVVTVGAAGDRVAELLPDDAEVIAVADWADGLSASLRAGLAVADREPCDAVVVLPVDTPDAAGGAVARVIAAGGPDPRAGLVQAVYDGRPGHPVLLGAAHLVAVAASVSGDTGARRYLAENGAIEVECGDLWSGDDVDDWRV